MRLGSHALFTAESEVTEDQVYPGDSVSPAASSLRSLTLPVATVASVILVVDLGAWQGLRVPGSSHYDLNCWSDSDQFVLQSFRL